MKLQFMIALLFMTPTNAGWFSRRRRQRTPVCNDVPKSVVESEWKCQPVTKTRTTWKDVTKWRKTKKNTTSWTNATRVVTRNKTIEYVLPPEDFWNPAKEAISQAILESFSNGTLLNYQGNAEAAECCEGAEVLILWGPSQVGKSTLICQTSRTEECPEVGDGSGESTTGAGQVAVWDTILGFIMDTVGLGDSLLRYSKEEAGQFVAATIGQVAQIDLKCAKWLVFDSMGSDAVHLRDSLLHLFKTFGEGVRGSIVVVATKPNLRVGREGVKRITKLQEIMFQQGLRELVIWRGPEKDQDSVVALEAALRRVHSASISELDQFWQRVSLKAKELWEEQVPRINNISIDIEEEYWVPELVEEEVEVNFTEPMPFLEEYEGQDCGVFSFDKTVMVRECK